MMSEDIELKQAAALIKTGRLDAAKSILSAYVKDFPESDLAWLLLSYALEEPRLQQASATRALRLNPQNEQAQARLNQLLRIQSPANPEASTQDFVNDILEIPDEDSLSDFEGYVSNTVSFEEELEQITNDTGSSRGDALGDFPVDSFLAYEDIEKTIGSEEDTSSGLKPKSVLIIACLFIGLISVGIISVKVFPKIFISKEDALKTAVAQTGTALATMNVGVHLPSTWTPSIVPTTTIGPTPTSTLEPTVTSTPIDTRTPRPSPTFEIMDPTMVAELELLQQHVSHLRGLSAIVNVNTHLISEIEVRGLLENYYFYSGGSDKEIQNTSRVLVMLGLIEPDYDLLTNTLNSLSAKGGGFYVQDTNQIFVIGEELTAIEKMVYVREYDHALINLNVNLARMSVFPSCEGNEDRCKAIQGLVGGDSTLLMQMWLEQSASPTDFEEIINHPLPNGILSEQDPPPYALRNLEFPSKEGKAFVETLLSNGDWSAVTQVYSYLPESTEQILHPEKYFSGERPITVPAVNLDSVLGEGWEKIKENTLGEWMTYLILGYGTYPMARLNESDAAGASEGWGGDHYQMYSNDETGETVLVVQWKWDQLSDTDEFASAMRNYLKNRFSAGEFLGPKRDCWSGNNQFTCLYSGDQQSLWIIAPSLDLIDVIADFYPDF
jgi:hypothetical protein